MASIDHEGAKKAAEAALIGFTQMKLALLGVLFSRLAALLTAGSLRIKLYRLLNLLAAISAIGQCRRDTQGN